MSRFDTVLNSSALLFRDNGSLKSQILASTNQENLTVMTSTYSNSATSFKLTNANAKLFAPAIQLGELSTNNHVNLTAGASIMTLTDSAGGGCRLAGLLPPTAADHAVNKTYCDIQCLQKTVASVSTLNDVLTLTNADGTVASSSIHLNKIRDQGNQCVLSTDVSTGVHKLIGKFQGVDAMEVSAGTGGLNIKNTINGGLNQLSITVGAIANEVNLNGVVSRSLVAPSMFMFFIDGSTLFGCTPSYTQFNTTTCQFSGQVNANSMFSSTTLQVGSDATIIASASVGTDLTVGGTCGVTGALTTGGAAATGSLTVTGTASVTSTFACGTSIEIKNAAANTYKIQPDAAGLAQTLTLPPVMPTKIGQVLRVKTFNGSQVAAEWGGTVSVMTSAARIGTNSDNGDLVYDSTIKEVMGHTGSLWFHVRLGVPEVVYVVTVTPGRNRWGFSNTKYNTAGVPCPYVSLVRNQLTRFDLSDSTMVGRDFRFSTTENGIHAGGEEFMRDRFYVGTPGTAGAYVDIKSGWHCCDVVNLYYYDTHIPNMGAHAATRNIIVTVAPGTNDYGTGPLKYYLDGVISPHLTTNIGDIIRMDLSDSSLVGHPLRFSNTPNGTHAGGIEYTNGVTLWGVAGMPGAYAEIIIDSATTLPIHYYCTNHWGVGSGYTAVNYTVTIAAGITPFALVSGLKYHIDGVLAPQLNLAPNTRYVFDLSDSSLLGTYFSISQTLDGVHEFSGSAYTTNVVSFGTPGNSGSYLQLITYTNVPSLYYYDQKTPWMGSGTKEEIGHARANMTPWNGVMSGHMLSTGGVVETNVEVGVGGVVQYLTIPGDQNSFSIGMLSDAKQGLTGQSAVANSDWDFKFRVENSTSSTTKATYTLVGGTTTEMLMVSGSQYQDVTGHVRLKLTFRPNNLPYSKIELLNASGTMIAEAKSTTTLTTNTARFAFNPDSASLIPVAHYSQTAPDFVYYVTVATGTNSWGAGNKFYFDGVMVSILPLTIGSTYRFNQAHNSNTRHSIRFSATPNGIHASNGSEYTSGITVVGVSGNASGYTEITVDSNTPNPIFFYCNAHPNMGNNQQFISPYTYAYTGSTDSTTRYLSRDATNYSDQTSIFVKPTTTPAFMPWAAGAVVRIPASKSGSGIKNYLFSHYKIGGGIISLCEENGKLVFHYGKETTNFVHWESSSGAIPFDSWIGIGMTFDGGDTHHEFASYPQRFRFYTMDLVTGAPTLLTGTFTVDQVGYDSDFASTGTFNVGAQNNTDAFGGFIASIGFTTVRSNIGHMNSSQLSEFTRDPTEFVTNFKIGKSYRRAHETTDHTSNFSLDDADSANSCQIYLCGDAFNGDTNTRISNYVSPLDVNTELTPNNDNDLYTQLLGTSMSIPSLTQEQDAFATHALTVVTLGSMKVYYIDGGYPTTHLSTVDGRYRFTLSDSSNTGYTPLITNQPDGVGVQIKKPDFSHVLIKGTPGQANSYMDFVVGTRLTTDYTAYYLNSVEEAKMGFRPIETSYNVTEVSSILNIDGIPGANLVLEAYKRYRFYVSSPTMLNHQFHLSTTRDGTHNGGVKYTHGVIEVGTPGNAGAYVDLITDNTTPLESLFYYCPNHSSEGNTGVQLQTLTTHTYAFYFDGKDYMNQNTNNINMNPLARSSGTTGRPWMVTAMFNPFLTTGNAHIWGQSSTWNSNGNIGLRLNNDNQIKFYYGSGLASNRVEWTSVIDEFRPSLWYSFTVVYMGGETGSNSSELSTYYNQFRVFKSDLYTGMTTDITSTGNWSHSANGYTGPIGGTFYVGTLNTTQKEFYGRINIMCVTTLKDATVPSETEISMFARDPVQWLNVYKVGKEFRKCADAIGTNTSNFQIGTSDAASSTQVWLMGDYTSFDTDDIVYNYVNPTHGTYLDLEKQGDTGINRFQTNDRFRSLFDAPETSTATVTPHHVVYELFGADDYFFRSTNNDLVCPLRSDKTIGAQPWWCTTMFAPISANNAYAHAWSSSNGTEGNGHIGLCLKSSNLELVFIYAQKFAKSGSNDVMTNGLMWETGANFFTFNEFQIITVCYMDNGPTGGTGASAATYGSNFKIFTTDLATGTLTDVTSQGTWTKTGDGFDKTTMEQKGEFTIGAGPRTVYEMDGYFMNHIHTTRNETTTPDLTELAMFSRDPERWLVEYKVGQNFRRPEQAVGSMHSSVFSLNDGTSASSTAVYLHGDGKSDEISTVDTVLTNIYNQVDISHINTKMIISGNRDYEMAYRFNNLSNVKGVGGYFH